MVLLVRHHLGASAYLGMAIGNCPGASDCLAMDMDTHPDRDRDLQHDCWLYLVGASLLVDGCNQRCTSACQLIIERLALGHTLVCVALRNYIRASVQIKHRYQRRDRIHEL